MDFETLNNTLNNASTHATKIKRVLIVDDDDLLTEAIKYQILAYSPDTVIDATSDPYEGLLMLADKRYDLALVDQKIPGLNGTQMLDKADYLKRYDPNAEFLNNTGTRIVVMSGTDMSVNDLKHYDTFNAQEFLRKTDLNQFLENNFKH